MKKIVFIILIVFVVLSTKNNVCFGRKWKPSINTSDPCNSSIATCITKADSSGYCGFPQDTMRLCTPHKIKYLSPKKQAIASASVEGNLTCRQKCMESYKKCRQKLDEWRASYDNSDEVITYSYATKLMTCNALKKTCLKKCK
jgi:hypothetical protein